MYSGRVDDPTFELARESRVIAVRVVPDDPSANRPLGEVRSRVFTVVALLSDALFLVVAVLLCGGGGAGRCTRWSRSRRARSPCGPAGQTLTAAAPEGWTGRVRVGDRVSGSLHLVGESDVLPGRR